jgi:flagellar biosynthetic protein FliQ
MSPALVADICGEALFLVIKIAMPMLLTALVIGVVVSLIQAITQIQEQSLTFIPKILGVCAALLLFSSYINSSIMSFTHKVFSIISQAK